MDGTLQTTYTLIYSFLTKRSHTKAARAVKIAAEDIIALDDAAIDGPQLDTIVEEWRQSQKIDLAVKAPSSLDSDSESSVSSSSSSSSSDSSSSSSSSSTRKKTVSETKVTPNSSTSSPSDSDSSDSSSVELLITRKSLGNKTRPEFVETSPSPSSHSNLEIERTSRRRRRRSKGIESKAKLTKASPSSSDSSSSDKSGPESVEKSPSPPSHSDLEIERTPSRRSKRIESKAKLTKASPSSSSSDSSSSDSDNPSACPSGPQSDGSESDDELSDVESAKTPSLKEKVMKGKVDGKRKFERDSSRTLTSGNNSEASDPEPLVTKEAKKVGKAKEEVVVNKGKGQKKKSDSASSSSDDSDSSSSESSDDTSNTIKETAKDQALKKRKAPDSSSSDSSGSESDSNSKMDEDPPADVKLPGKSKNDAKDTTSSLTVQVTKKLKTSEGGISVSTATAGPVRTKENSTKPPRNGNGNNGSSGRKSNTPFQRCNPDQVPADTVVDNRYEAKAGPSNDYGQRAHQDLIVTRGAGFRKEKNKKKRGSYRGGEITLESHSFKFT